MTKKILIVEYDAKVVDCIKDLFPYTQIVFNIAEDGIKAKESLSGGEYDMVITAAMLPKFHGFQLSEYIAKTYPEIKTIVISGIYKGVDYKHQATTHYKASDFFEKPLPKDEFKKRVVELLGLNIEDLENSISEKVKAMTDTAKVPLYEKPNNKDGKQLTSNDIFGDIIKDVEKNKAKSDILNQKDYDKPSKAENMSKTIKIDLNNIDNLVKKPEKKKISKKIEDDISKKLEETLSGLGLNDKPKKKTSQKPGSESFFEKKEKNPDKPKQENKVEDKYDILGLIARGGMAEIYKAKKKGVKGFKKILALKKILTGYGEDDKFIEMFVDEAKIAAELSHPNIVQIYDFEKTDNTYFIAMEFVQGKDLRKILKLTRDINKKLPEELSIFIINKILEALSYAHSAKDDSGNALNIVHRDVSPPNILISYNGEIKLTDFGVSKASNKMHQTISGALKGKLLYMAPEQARGEKDIDHRADLYSVGAIMFELITGRKLFSDTSEMAVLKKVQEGIIEKPSDVFEDIDKDLEKIILKALSKSVTERYQSSDEMIADIENYLTSNYNALPTSVHIAHYITDLCKEDILKDNLKINLKPVPVKIKRLEKKNEEEAVSLEGLEVPDTSTPFAQEIEEEHEKEENIEIGLKENIEIDKIPTENEIFEEEPVKDDLNIDIPTEEVMENPIETEKDDLPNIDSFSPAIDIDLSKEEEIPEIQQPTMTIKEIEEKLKNASKPEEMPKQEEEISEITNTEKQKKKKPFALIAVIFIVLLAGGYFIISSGILSKDKRPKGPIIISTTDINIVNKLLHKKGEEKPFTGFVKSSWNDLQIKEKTEYRDGLKNGNYVFYFQNGKKKIEGKYLNDKKNGKWTVFNEKNNIISTTNFLNGLKNGREEIRDDLGRLISVKEYKLDKELRGKTFKYLDKTRTKLEESIFEKGVLTIKKVWDKEGNRIIDAVLINGSNRNNLKIGRRTSISYKLLNCELETIPIKTKGSIYDKNDTTKELVSIEVSDNVKSKAKVLKINGRSRSVTINTNNTIIQFIINKPKPVIKASPIDTSKGNQQKQNNNTDNPTQTTNNKTTTTTPNQNINNSNTTTTQNQTANNPSDKQKKIDAKKQQKILDDLKKKQEAKKLADKKKAEEEKQRLADEEKKRLEEEKQKKALEEENKRIEAAKLKKLEEEKKKNALKVGDLVADVDTVPIPISTPAPKLSKKLRKKIKGNSITMTLSLLVDENGAVKRIKRIIKSGIPQIDIEVAGIVYKWKFKPATKYGKKVKTWFTKLITINK